MQRFQLARLTAVLALTSAVIALGFVLVTGGSTYVLHAQFSNAGQLVSGDLVTVAGHQVGSVGSIKLAGNRLADVELDIADAGITPVHSATLARIGQLSLTGVANRFVGLTLSGGGHAISSGGTLPSTQTRGIVDLDVFLDALTPRVRVSFQQILKTGAYFYRQPTAGQLNQAAEFLNPSLSQTAQLGAEVVADRFALQRFISSTATVTGALAARSADLAGAVTNTAATFRAVAGQRVALQDLLSRAPGALQQTRGVLADVNYTLGVLNPALTHLQPAAPRLAAFLRAAVPAARDAIPTIAGVQALIPSATAALLSLPPAERQATPAVRSLTGALLGAMPILSGLRPYTPDAVAGFFNGVGGAAGGAYDANGHYLKSMLTVQGSAASLSGLLSLLGQPTGALGPFTGARTGLVAPCPGGGNPPATDRSNPWTVPDVLRGASDLCNPAHDQKP